MVDVIFLGAGASQPFAIPTMVEFPDEIEKRLSGELIRMLRDIRNTLVENDRVDDLESLFTVINGYEASGDPASLDPAVLYRYKNELGNAFRKADKTILSNLSDLRASILKTILEKCNPSRAEVGARIYDVYDEFFEAISGAYGMQIGALLHQQPFNIFTTNYDTCVETYFDRARHERADEDITLDDGVSADRRHWSPFEYRNGKVQLWKLHGSIDMSYTDRGIVKHQGPLPEVLGEQTFDNMMIFPVMGKFVYDDPFFEMFSRFKSYLITADRAIFVGYSFRDVAISSILTGATLERSYRARRRRGRRLEIFVLSRHASTIADTRLEKVRTDITAIDGRFEVGEDVQKLASALTKR